MSSPLAQGRATILIGRYAHTEALHTGAVGSDGLVLELRDLQTDPGGIRRMLRELAFDFCEMPIVTAIQAKLAGLGIVLVPTALLCRFQHAALIHDASRGRLSPGDLAGSRIGVRSWTRTTGVWVRGILAEEHGIESAHIRWITTDECHLPPAEDPSERRASNGNLLDMLIAGELDAVIGERSGRPGLWPVFEDPETQAHDWCRRQGFVPLNHVLVVQRDLAHRRPEVVREVDRLLGAAKARAAPSEFELAPRGLAANRAALERILAYAVRQRIIARRPAIEELFEGCPELAD